MWKPAWIAAVTALQMAAGLATSSAAAQEVDGRTPAKCLGEHHRYVFSEPVAIPDDDPGGVTIGPLRISRDACAIRGLLIALSISHTYSGELAMSLHYDADRDGNYDASSALEIYLARMSPCAGTELWAYPIELGGTYFFNDEGWEAAGEDASLAIFEGLDAGGDFYLTVVDHGPGHTGIVSNWAVYSETVTSGERSMRLQSADDAAARRATASWNGPCEVIQVAHLATTTIE